MMSDAFNITLDWREGSVPPPYYYEYRIIVDARGVGEVTMRSGYPPQAEEWREAFKAPLAQIASLREVVGQHPRSAEAAARAASVPPSIGAGRTSVHVVSDDATIDESDATPSQREWVGRIRTVLNALVPSPVWRDLEDKRKRYVAVHEQH